MATKKNSLQTGTPAWQRYSIWVILILTIVSTVALYVSSFLQTESNSEAQKKQSQVLKKYQDYRKKVEEQAKELSAKYYDSFKEYEKAPVAFNAASVKELTKKDLKEGNGEEFTDSTTKFQAYYIGWKPDGIVFDGSFENGRLKSPVVFRKEGKKWGLIEGWSEGLKGMKVGGIRELSIPADKAYGAQGSVNQEDSSKTIGPNTPLKFIVMLIPEFQEIPQPSLEENQND
ncbi:MAG: FKBP-type peptidyl-prolyl cis-trans isomerase [Candidatus Saccharimonas sp.]|nr:MAG: FKBP-type peptidyl-prolyl cis-trans isomerase [Candidatus Saccharimonas sp.]